MKKSFVCMLFLCGSFVSYGTAYANFFTLPVAGGSVNSYFDHNNPGSPDNDHFTRYDGAEWLDGSAGTSTCTLGVNCYDGHRGIDFSGSVGTDVLAAATGTVSDVDYDSCEGNIIRVWHNDSDLATVYAHLSATSTTETATIGRGQKMGEVGNTGSCSGGAHLHFGVLDDDTYDESSHRIDPYGWQGTTTDPWSYNQGYLWTTSPPSLNQYTTVSGNISATTTWRGNYLLTTSRTLNSGVTLTVEPGTVVKFSGGTTKLTVNGILNAYGDADSPIYFTSYNDDVGGDWNGDGSSTTPAAADWHDIRIVGGTANLDNTVVRYGGYTAGGSQSFANLLVYDNGTLNVANSLIASSTLYGIYLLDATANIATSTIRNNGEYGIQVSSGNSTTTLTNNTFSDNSLGAALLAYSLIDNDTLFASGNVATGSGLKGFHVAGTLGSSQTWMKDLPYVISGKFTIASGATLTIDPGSIIKFNVPSKLDVNGTLLAQGTSTDRVYFTSLRDDTIGGDTNDDGSATTPSAGNWCGISSNANASTTISYGDIRYGGNTLNMNCNGNAVSSNVINILGHMNILNTNVSTSMEQGVYALGTTTVLNSEIFNNPVGIRVDTTSAVVANNNIHNNATFGLRNDSSATTTAENNYWGSSAGPYHSIYNPGGATTSIVTNKVDFDPWLTSAP